MAKEVAVKAETIESIQEAPVEFGPAMGVDFDTLASESIVLPGQGLVKDEELDDLVGVDLIITKMVFRQGLARREDNPWMKATGHGNAAYVSIEATINPVQDIKRVNRARKANGLRDVPDHFKWDNAIVFNDGSTGIYRQAVAFLAMTGYIQLPDGKMDGPGGTTVLDTIPEEWTDITVGDVKFDNDGFQTYTANCRLRVSRGIRISEYTSDFNPDSKTRYLAG